MRPARFDVAEALAQARRELPLGPVTGQLRNYCGRVWDVLRTPAFAEAYRQSLTRHTRAAASEVIEACLADVRGLLAEGVRAGELRPVSHGPVARLLVSSLVAQALWCTDRAPIDARIAGGCSRVVAETLGLLLPAILVTGTNVGNPPPDQPLDRHARRVEGRGRPG